MKIIICGSITSSQEIMSASSLLEGRGHEVGVPEGVIRDELRGRTEVSNEEKAIDKIKYDLIRNHYKKIQSADIVLIVNPEKRGIPGYIGGNTFLEMGFAYVLLKRLYCMYDLPSLSYLDEMLAMQPHILHGNLRNLII